MTECLNNAEQRLRRGRLCCYGAPGCTAAPLSKKIGTSPLKTEKGAISTPKGPRLESGSEHSCPIMNAKLSNDASLQDLYLLLRGLSDGGFEVSVTVQATPSKQSAPSPSDTVEPYGYSTRTCQSTESHLCLGVVIQPLRSIMHSSKQRGSFDCIYCSASFSNKDMLIRHYDTHKEPRNRRY